MKKGKPTKKMAKRSSGKRSPSVAAQRNLPTRSNAFIWDPFADFDRLRKGLHEEMDSLFNGFFGPSRMLPSLGVEKVGLADFRAPVAHIHETESAVIATFEIPGVNKDQIQLHISDDSIEVKAESGHESEDSQKGVYSYAKSSSAFYRRLPLPASVHSDQAEASYKDGILRVEMPKVKEVSNRSRHIQIK